MDRNVVTTVTEQADSSSEEEDGPWGKNDYYRAAFRNLMLVVNAQAAVILLLSAGFAYYIYSGEDQDRYFAETIEGRSMRMAALSRPNMGRIAMAKWSVQAVTQVMTFGFNDIDERFALSQKNFTEKGWQSFRKAIIDGGLIKSVQDLQQIITAFPTEEPTVSSEGLVGGVYTWEMSIPLLLTVRAGSEKATLRKTVMLVVEEIPTQDNPNGVGIAKWLAY